MHNIRIGNIIVFIHIKYTYINLYQYYLRCRWKNKGLPNITLIKERQLSPPTDYRCDSLKLEHSIVYWKNNIERQPNIFFHFFDKLFFNFQRLGTSSGSIAKVRLAFMSRKMLKFLFGSWHNDKSILRALADYSDSIPKSYQAMVWRWMPVGLRQNNKGKGQANNRPD